MMIDGHRVNFRIDDARDRVIAGWLVKQAHIGVDAGIQKRGDIVSVLVAQESVGSNCCQHNGEKSGFSRVPRR
jgi:hypothetical protein